jgi:hypothetical protein
VNIIKLAGFLVPKLSFNEKTWFLRPPHLILELRFLHNGEDHVEGG